MEPKTILGNGPLFRKSNSLASLGTVVSIVPVGCIWISNQSPILFSGKYFSTHGSDLIDRTTLFNALTSALVGAAAADAHRENR
jgi:hypothetical protein